MGYALFAQRKLMLTGSLNGLQLQQTQRSNEQLQLATSTLSLQKQLTSLQTAQANQLARLYEDLANSGNDVYEKASTLTNPEIVALRNQLSNLRDAKNNAGTTPELEALNKQLANVQAAKDAEVANAVGTMKPLGTYKDWMSKEGNSTVYTSPFTGFRYLAAGGENNFGYTGTDASWEKALADIVDCNNTLEKNSANHTDGDEEWSAKNIAAYNNKYNQDLQKAQNAAAKKYDDQINQLNKQIAAEQKKVSDAQKNYDKQISNLEKQITKKEETIQNNIPKTEEDASRERERIQDEIHKVEQKFKVEEDVINRQIYQVSIKENAIEMEVKRLDTKVTAVQKQLEATQEAEGSGIDRATPKFNGIG
ncbi:hypothetical protein II906_12550 [bacterium]|nr:hypothetical protein [bacterium]